MLCFQHIMRFIFAAVRPLCLVQLRPSRRNSCPNTLSERGVCLKIRAGPIRVVAPPTLCRLFTTESGLWLVKCWGKIRLGATFKCIDKNGRSERWWGKIQSGKYVYFHVCLPRYVQIRATIVHLLCCLQSKIGAVDVKRQNTLSMNVIITTLTLICASDHNFLSEIWCSCLLKSFSNEN